MYVCRHKAGTHNMTATAFQSEPYSTQFIQNIVNYMEHSLHHMVRSVRNTKQSLYHMVRSVKFSVFLSFI